MTTPMTTARPGPSPVARAESPIRNTSRNGSTPPTGPSSPFGACPVCQQPLASTRARYCSAACRQAAFRLRHPPATTAAPAPTAVAAALRRQRALVAHTVYECPRCNERRLGERRCPDCNVFCRAVGLGGTCPDCDAVISLVELVGEEVLPVPP